jgi:hypothetical protein
MHASIAFSIVVPGALLLVATAVWYSVTEDARARNYTPSTDPQTDACNLDATNIHHNTYALLFILGWFLATLSFQLCCPMEYEPANWHVPRWLMPWLPALGIGLIVFRWAMNCPNALPSIVLPLGALSSMLA